MQAGDCAAALICVKFRVRVYRGAGCKHASLFKVVVVLNIKSVAQLRALLLEVETALGLVDLSANERDILYAINEVSVGSPRTARSESIRTHPLAAAIPQASYHRALKSLVHRGLVEHAPDTKAGLYVVPMTGAV